MQWVNHSLSHLLYTFLNFSCLIHNLFMLIIDGFELSLLSEYTTYSIATSYLSYFFTGLLACIRCMIAGTLGASSSIWFHSILFLWTSFSMFSLHIITNLLLLLFTELGDRNTINLRLSRTFAQSFHWHGFTTYFEWSLWRRTFTDFVLVTGYLWFASFRPLFRIRGRLSSVISITVSQLTFLFHN